jgi:hypothetical protein
MQVRQGEGIRNLGKDESVLISNEIYQQLNDFLVPARKLGCSLILVCFFATGCAFTRTETKLNLTGTVNAPLKSNPRAGLELGEITDARSDSEKFVLAHKQNDYGKTTGAYVTKGPVADILRNGLAAALDRNGFFAKPGGYRLTGILESVEFTALTGVLKATVESKFTARFELIETKSGRILWHDTFSGRAKDKTAWGTSALVGELSSKAAEDLISKLLVDRSFREFFEPSTSSQ